jgi:hypothetical protein
LFNFSSNNLVFEILYEFLRVFILLYKILFIKIVLKRSFALNIS